MVDNIDDDNIVSQLFCMFLRNGKKDKKAPRLFCDICDMFDLHDTEDCPTQASSEADAPASLLNHSSTAYHQHSHHGGTRGAVREYCDNCESNYSFTRLFWFTHC